MNINLEGYKSSPAFEAALTYIYLLHAHGITAVIHGGFLRDLVLGKEYNDIDIAIGYIDSERVQQILELDAKTLRAASSEYANHARYVCDWKKTIQVSDREVDINIIAWDDTSYGEWCKEEVAAGCDWGLSQISYDVGGLHISENFIADVINEHWTLYRDDNEARSYKRYHRLKEKYPWPINHGVTEKQEPF